MLVVQVSLNTWLWSAVFHTRDVGWTEKMDYFSAALLIVCGIVVQFIRSHSLQHHMHTVKDVLLQVEWQTSCLMVCDCMPLVCLLTYVNTSGSGHMVVSGWGSTCFM